MHVADATPLWNDFVGCWRHSLSDVHFLCCIFASVQCQLLGLWPLRRWTGSCWGWAATPTALTPSRLAAQWRSAAATALSALWRPSGGGGGAGGGSSSGGSSGAPSASDLIWQVHVEWSLGIELACRPLVPAAVIRPWRPRLQMSDCQAALRWCGVRAAEIVQRRESSTIA